MSMTRSNNLRWTHDNDHRFGPFLYAKEARTDMLVEAVLSSAGEEGNGCNLRLRLGRHALLIALPPFIRPWLEEFGDPVEPAMAARIGRKRHYHTHRREFGFYFNNAGTVGGAVHFLLKFGAQTHDSRTDMNWGKFLPWTDTRHVRHSLYDLSGALFATVPQKCDWLRGREIVDHCPTQTFKFLDFDGEALSAKTRIEEREWRHGTGWFKWLSWFRKPLIQRSLDIEFSGETGERKGSWKGGTMGHSIGMLPGELHEAAFRRYCAEHGMTFVA